MDVLGLAENKSSCQKFLKRNFPNAQHMYTDNVALRSPGQAECFVCLVPGCQVSSRRADVASGGVPCPPFSQMRVKSGDTAKTGPPGKHPAYCLVMEEFFAYVDARRPRSPWLE